MRPLTANLPSGRVVAGRYRILGPLGSGGMGEVYLASHELIGRRVAIKVVDRLLAANAEVKERLFAEARAASASGHPNIVEIFDAGELDDGRSFIVMEYLDGHDVWDEVSQGRLAVDRACWIVREVALAVEAAHRTGVVHRDLKPENVYVVDNSGGERIKVLDFGIAFGGAPEGARLTRPGVSMGTPTYMAPEQSFGGPARPALDIYAMGVMLFELLAGKPPFDARDPLEILRRKVHEPAPSLAEHRPDAPAPVIAVVDACLRTDPNERPETAAEVAEALRPFCTPRASSGVARPTLALSPEAVDPRPLTPSSDNEHIATRVLDEPAPVPRRRAWMSWAIVASVGLAVALVALVGSPGVPELSSRDGLVVPTVDIAPPELAIARPRLAMRSPPASLPAPDPTPVRSVAVARPARSDGPAHCERAVRGAEQARNVHDWSGVLRHTAEARCFANAAVRLELRVKALAELQRLDECIELGKDRREPAIAKVVDLCRRRLSP